MIDITITGEDIATCFAFIALAVIGYAIFKY